MNVIEVEAKTRDLALEKASEQLDIPVYELKYEVLEEDKGGLFGIKKSVRLRIMYTGAGNGPAEKKLAAVLTKMGIKARLDANEDAETISIHMESEDAALLIGREGKTLEALQYLVNLMHARSAGEGAKKVVLDIESYRKKRESTLRSMAQSSARKVQDTGQPIVLAPMNPYERRIVHMTLQDHASVRTKSEGNGLYKRVRLFREGAGAPPAPRGAPAPNAAPNFDDDDNRGNRRIDAPRQPADKDGNRRDTIGNQRGSNRNY